MNSSFYFLDRATHLKIGLLAALLAGAIVAVGESAQLRSAHPAAPPPAQAARSVKALSLPVAKRDTKPEAKQPAVFTRDAV